MNEKVIERVKELIEGHVIMFTRPSPITAERRFQLAVQATIEEPYATKEFVALAYNVALTLLIEARAQRDAALIGVRV